MERDPDLWAIVLAMGDEPDSGPSVVEGRGGSGVPAPYRTLPGGSTPLERALLLATAVGSAERTLMVVSQQHARWWRPLANELPADNTVVQPCDRGTACSALLPLLQVLLRDPEAVVLITRADHHVRLEEVLRRSILRAVRHLRSDPDALVLLGLEPEGEDDPVWGWIDPGPSGPDGVREVLAMGRASARERAEELLGSGALWNSFTFVIRAALLEALFESALPWLPLAFGYAVTTAGGAPGGRILEKVYRHLPRVDLADVVLHGSTEELRVLPVPPCGWTHLGPSRPADPVTVPDALEGCPPTLADPSPTDAPEHPQPAEP